MVAYFSSAVISYKSFLAPTYILHYLAWDVDTVSKLRPNFPKLSRCGLLLIRYVKVVGYSTYDEVGTTKFENLARYLYLGESPQFCHPHSLWLSLSSLFYISNMD